MIIISAIAKLELVRYLFIEFFIMLLIVIFRGIVFYLVLWFMIVLSQWTVRIARQCTFAVWSRVVLFEVKLCCTSIGDRNHCQYWKDCLGFWSLANWEFLWCASVLEMVRSQSSVLSNSLLMTQNTLISDASSNLEIRIKTTTHSLKSMQCTKWRIDVKVIFQYHGINLIIHYTNILIV